MIVLIIIWANSNSHLFFSIFFFQNPVMWKGLTPLRITLTTPSGGNPTICTGYQVSSNQPRSKRLCEFPPGFLKLAISFFLCADKEYLHKDANGNVMLHNAETKEESLYLSNSTFVIIHLLYVSCGWVVGRNNPQTLALMNVVSSL